MHLCMRMCVLKQCCMCLQVRQMEAEVVAMTAAMLNGGPGTAAPEACGAMTSGMCRPPDKHYHPGAADRQQKQDLLQDQQCRHDSVLP